MLSSNLYSNPHGIRFRAQTVRLRNSTGSATVVGGVYQLDMSHTGGATTYTGTDRTSVFGSIDEVDATGMNMYPLVVATEVVAAASDGEFVISGVGPILCQGPGGTALTEVLHAEAALVGLDSDAHATAQEVQRVVAIPLEATATATLTLLDCLFDGMGLGFQQT